MTFYKILKNYLENIKITLVRKAKRIAAFQNKVKVSSVFPVVHFAQSIIFKYNQGEFRDFKHLMERNAGCCAIHTCCGNHSYVFLFSGVSCM